MAVELVTMPGVELARTGQWSASTGVATLTRQDLAAAVDALSCPHVRNPVIKLGHTDPRFDGQPAIGRIVNLEVVDGYSLRGDLDGMPAWLGEVLASAYPSRSIEGEWKHTCSAGHTHPFVLTALSLLGETPPAIGSLESVDDIALLWGVDSESQAVVIAAKEGLMTKTIAASATVEDIRRAYYETAGYVLWIEEIQLDPLQLIVVDDDTGKRSRVPVVIDPSADGAGAIAFGTPVEVVVRYDDVAVPAVPSDDSAATESFAASRFRFASRADSRRDIRAGSNKGENMARKIAAAAPGESGDANPGGLTDDQLAKVRELCGLTEEADPATLAAALNALVTKVNAEGTEAETETETETETESTESTESGDETETETEDEKKKVAASGAGPKTVTVDAAQFSQMQATLGRFVEFEREQAEKRADDMVEAAFKAGKIARTSKPEYIALARANYDGTKKLLDKLAPSAAFSVGEMGHSVDVDPTTDVRDSDVYKNWSI
ncbi:capsid maturation protease [Gordonia phage Francois]|nr:capsid maturation protease [Gordonia phage Francois]